MTLTYDVVQATLSGTLPSGTTTVHFIDTWSGHTVSGDTSCSDTDTSVVCNLSWESYFTSNNLYGNPAGTHSIVATAKNSIGTILGTYTLSSLNVPSDGLPILAIDVPCDAQTHDHIYVIRNDVDTGYLPVPAYLQQPAGTYLNLPITGFSLHNPYDSSVSFDDPKIQVSNGKVYCLTNTTLGSNFEICYRTIGDHTSAWTHLIFASDLISQFGGSGGLSQSITGYGLGSFKVDALGGVWVAIGGNLIGDTTKLNHVVYLPPSSPTWQVVYSGDNYRTAAIFFAGPKKTIPSIFTEAYPSLGQPGILGMWNGTNFTYMFDTTQLSTNNDTGVGWVQYTVSPAIAHSSTSMFGYKSDLVVNGQIDFYYMTDIETLGPYLFSSVGGAPTFGDTNLWPTSLGVSILWNIGHLPDFSSSAWIGASFADSTFDPTFEVPDTMPETLTLTASVLTPPSGSRFGAFPIVLLNSTTSFSTAYSTGAMVETEDNYILCFLAI